ncbi:MAG: hypothetical protein AB1299_05005 [Thermoproteota archaeon]|nr:hypothetical protein [Candidatus Nitrosotenuis sp.]
MAEVQLVPFIGWSAVTAVLFFVVALVYRRHTKKSKADAST